MNILDIKILEETIEAVQSIDQETINMNESTQTVDTTSNVTIEDSTQVKECKPDIICMSPSRLEELEDKINSDSLLIDDTITESFYNLNRNLYQMIALSETISVDVIHQQYKILTECSYGTDEYNDKISTLIEASGENLLQKLVAAIQTFIEWCKDALSKLGVQISLHFVDYEKWATNKENDLIKKASEVGNRVSSKFHKWNKEDLFNTLPISSIESVADSYIKLTNNKDKMLDYIAEFKSKYDTVKDAADDVYVHALATAIGGNPDDRINTNKKMAIDAFTVKLMGDEKDIYMDSKTTSKLIGELKKVKTSSSKFAASMRSNSVNSKFTELIKDAKKEMTNRENKPDSTKYQYFNIRFNVLTAVQNAINDAYKIKCHLMTRYTKELYNACKTLDSFKEESSNESINFNINDNYIEKTLHA